MLIALGVDVGASVLYARHAVSQFPADSGYRGDAAVVFWGDDDRLGNESVRRAGQAADLFHKETCALSCAWAEAGRIKIFTGRSHETDADVNGDCVRSNTCRNKIV